MYHDQGLAAFNALAFEDGVNFTAGLPIVRTSPDHGTAFDIAGKNEANELSMRSAIYLSMDIYRTRKFLKEIMPIHYSRNRKVPAKSSVTKRLSKNLFSL